MTVYIIHFYETVQKMSHVGPVFDNFADAQMYLTDADAGNAVIVVREIQPAA